MKKLTYKRDTFPNCYLQQSIQALKKCVIIFIIVAVFTCIILSAKARFSLRRSENCVSIFYTLLGAKKKKGRTYFKICPTYFKISQTYFYGHENAGENIACKYGQHRTSFCTNSFATKTSKRKCHKCTIRLTI